MSSAPVTTPALPAPPLAARIRKRWRWGYPILMIAVILTTLVLGIKAYREMTKPRVIVKVTLDNLRGLHIGAPLELNGERIGEAVAINRTDDLRRYIVEFRLVDDEKIAKRVRQEGNEWYIDYLEIENLHFHGETRIIQGPSAVLRLGDEEGAFRDEFIGHSERPPDGRLPTAPLRATVFFPDAWGLRKGATVRANGVDVGVVESVGTDDETLQAKTVIAFFEKNKDTCPYLRESTRYHINHASLTTRGVEGDASTVIYGPHLVAIVDPLLAAAPFAEKFQGSSNPPPLYLPEPGEKEISLESPDFYPPDTPIFYRGKLAGYLHRFRQANDGNSYFLRARIYRWAQPQLTAASKFFPQTKFKAQLFKSNGDIVNFSKILSGRSPVDFSGLETPKVEVPNPESFFRPAIEFRTPPGEGTKPTYGETEGEFYLHREPQEEWLTWLSSMPGAAAESTAAALPLPNVLRANFTWRENYKPLSGRKFDGLVLPVNGGVAGLKELFEPSLDPANVAYPTFSINDQVLTRGAITPLTGELRSMELAVAPELAWPATKLGTLDRPCDIIVVTASGGRAVDAQRLTREGELWVIAATAGFNQSWNGAPVVATSGPALGDVVGFVRVDEKAARAVICPLAK